MTRHALIAAFGLAALLPTTGAWADTGAAARTIATDGERERTAEVTTPATTVTVAFEEPTYDGLQAFLDEEACAAMSKGDFRKAWYLFWRLLEIDPDDTRALREAGRVAQALGKLDYSVTALARVEAARPGTPDPELHFLRGEALDALGRHGEAEQEWATCERELAVKPLDQQGTMWLARIAALRKDLGKSVALYQSVMPIDRQSSEYAAVVLSMVEAYALSREWAGAERELRAFLVAQPEHPRAKAILAWVLEARGTVVEAVQLRAAFAEEWTDHPQKTVEYARVLERVYRLPAALARYREARALGVPDLNDDIARVHGRVAPELAAGIATLGDASGDVTGWNAGANIPFGGRRRVIATASRVSSTGGNLLGEDTSTTGTLWAMASNRDGHRLALGATYRDSAEYGGGVGGSAWLATSQDRRLQLQMRADYGQAWRESATTVREGGVYDQGSAVAFAGGLDGKLLLQVGLQGRRLALAPRMGEAAAHAVQILGIGGLDYTLWSAPGALARGEILGDDMLAPRTMSTSIVASYRHYELSGDDPFGQQLTLVKRSSLDEVSLTVSKVADPRGIVSGELRGGYGHDWVRDAERYRAGASIMLSLTGSSRFTFDYDVASESQTGLVGQRHLGQAVLHVDL